MSKVKIGIIGCGGIANNKHMPSIKANSELGEMVAFCDIIVERAEKACKEYGAPGAKVYADYKELLADPEVEVVHVCTPNVAHCPITCDAFAVGKHVMCEKPMAATVADAQKMIDAWKASGKMFTVGYQNRFRADTQTLHASCEDGELGDIYFAKAHAIRRRAVPTWGVFPNKALQGGGPLIDIGTHALDLTLWMMNNYKPRMVVGSVFKKLGDQKESGNAWGDWDSEKITVEDSAFGFIVMENGATISLESAWALNTLDIGEAKTTLCGVKAGADMKDGLRINRVKYNKWVTEEVTLDSTGVAFYGVKGAKPSEIEARMWLDAIKNDTDVVVKPEQAIVVTRILEAIYRSGKTGKPVFFGPDGLPQD